MNHPLKTMNQEMLTITEYLESKGIPFKEVPGELAVKCLFNGCDDNSRINEYHLYFSKVTTQYDCKKCGEKGNIYTLAQFLGDSKKSLFLKKTEGKQVNKTATEQTLESVSLETILKCHIALPASVRTYLNDRGIPDDLINEFKLGWGSFYGSNWITIPIPKKNPLDGYSMLKLRRDPDSSGTQIPKMMVWPTGATHELFDWSTLKGATSITICEGELDCLVLLSKGIPAITSTGGCGTFKQEWIKEFANLESVTICYDNDESGKKGALSVINSLKTIETLKLFQIILPEDMGKGLKDVTDYFTRFGGNPESFNAMTKPVSRLDSIGRIMRVTKPDNPLNFEQWRETVRANFPDLLFPAEMCLGVLCQLLIKDVTNPFALILVDVPSSGKTITVNFLDGIEGLTYASDKFTPASFVSNAANVPREKLADVDLLPRIRNKAFLIRDMATIFSKREEDLSECIGIMTRVLDGEGIKTDSGVHGERGYTGEHLFMLIAASTPLQPHVWRTMGSFGARLFFLNMNTKNKSDLEHVDQLISSSVKDKELSCRIASKRLILSLWGNNQDGIEWNKTNDRREHLLIIARCGKLLASLRGVINGMEKTNEDEIIYQQTVIEKPDRIIRLFYNQCRGLAVLAGRRAITDEDVSGIIKLAIDSAPPNRARLFRLLIANDGELTTTQVEELLKENSRVSKPTAVKEMAILEALDVCEIIKKRSGVGRPENVLRIKDEYKWFASEECLKLINCLK